MGVDLKLLPVERSDNNFSYSQTVLKLDRDRKLFDRLNEKETDKTAGPNFRSYVSRRDGKESHYGVTENDAYGEPVKLMEAGVLVHHIVWHQHKYKISPRNEAVLAYLQSLPPRHEVALFWH